MAFVIPKYSRHSSGRARVTINGRTYYLGKFGSAESKRKYESLIREWLASGRSSSFGVNQENATVAELMVAYLKYLKRERDTGPNSEARRIKYAFKPLAELYTHLKVRDFKPAQLRAVREVMIDRGWVRKNINSSVWRIIAMFRWGVANDLVPLDVHAMLRTVEALRLGLEGVRESEDVEPVAEEIVEATIRFCSPVVADMVRIQLATGARPGEIVVLTPAILDRSNAEVWEARLPKHKTRYLGKHRTLFFTKICHPILEKYLDRPADERLFRPCDSEKQRRARIKRKTPLNSGNSKGNSARTRAGRPAKRKPGTAYSTVSYRRAITYASKRAFPIPEGASPKEAAVWKKVHWWSPSQLRHTAATKMRDLFGIEAASALLQHSRVSTTEIYTSNLRKRSLEAAELYQAIPSRLTPRDAETEKQSQQPTDPSPE